MAYSVEVTDEFQAWWSELSESQQSDVEAIVQLLEERGIALGHPFSTRINGSRHSHMRELRVQSGGDKTGRDRFYEEMVPLADRLYDVYLDELKKEGLL